MFHRLVEIILSFLTHVKSDNDNKWKLATISEHRLPVLGAREYEHRTHNYRIQMCTLVLPFPEPGRFRKLPKLSIVSGGVGSAP